MFLDLKKTNKHIWIQVYSLWSPSFEAQCIEYIICNITDHQPGVVGISRKEAKHPNTHIVWAATSKEFLINIIDYPPWPLVFTRLKNEKYAKETETQEKKPEVKGCRKKVREKKCKSDLSSFSNLIWGQCFISCNIYPHSVMTFPSCSTGILMGLKLH